MRGLDLSGGRGGLPVPNDTAVPPADPDKDDDADEGEKGKPHDGVLAAGHDNGSGEKGPERASGVPANLEERLGEPVLSSGAQMGHP